MSSSQRWALYDYVDHRGNNAIKLWIASLQKIEQQKINLRIAMLGANGDNLSPSLFSDSEEPHIKKIRIQGHVAVRLFFCRGPLNSRTEFTFLFGTTEKDNKTVDKHAGQQAEERRQLILGNPNKYRCIHE